MNSASFRRPPLANVRGIFRWAQMTDAADELAIRRSQEDRMSLRGPGQAEDHAAVAQDE